MEQIGVVAQLRGEVVALRPEDTDIGRGERVLAPGSPVYLQDEIVTKGGGAVEIKFTDDSVLSQGENSRINLDSYVYEPADPTHGNLLYKMGMGTFRVVTGAITQGNPDGVKFQSPLATIGIRGTGVDFLISPEGEKIGVFDYHQMDVVISTALGARFITGENKIVDVSHDGALGAPRRYTPAEHSFFKTAAPITTVPGLTETAPSEGEEVAEGETESHGETGEEAGEDEAGEVGGELESEEESLGGAIAEEEKGQEGELEEEHEDELAAQGEQEGQEELDELLEQAELEQEGTEREAAEEVAREGAEQKAEQEAEAAEAAAKEAAETAAREQAEREAVEAAGREAAEQAAAQQAAEQAAAQQAAAMQAAAEATARYAVEAAAQQAAEAAALA
ncbi:MAG: hypothetical protein AB1916_15270, partial [Thermodesulfobacteriota bacterium]